MKTVGGDILNDFLSVYPKFKIMVRCHKCGSYLNICDNPSKYTKDTGENITVFAEPCQNCFNEKLQKLKELL